MAGYRMVSSAMASRCLSTSILSAIDKIHTTVAVTTSGSSSTGVQVLYADDNDKDNWDSIAEVPELSRKCRSQINFRKKLLSGYIRTHIELMFTKDDDPSFHELHALSEAARKEVLRQMGVPIDMCGDDEN